MASAGGSTEMNLEGSKLGRDNLIEIEAKGGGRLRAQRGATGVMRPG